MKKRADKNSGEILKNISRLSIEAEWTDSELEESLREVGIDPGRFVSQILAEANQFLSKYEEQGVEKSPVGQVTASAQPKPVEQEKAAKSKARTRKVAKTSGGKSPNTTTSLLEQCRKKAVNYSGLHLILELSPALVTKLNLRLLKFSSIPRQIIQKIAEAIGVRVDEVIRCIQGEPLMAEGVRFRADSAPRIPEQQDFFDAVEKDRFLSPERKQQLLSLKDKEDDLGESERRVA